MKPFGLETKILELLNASPAKELSLEQIEQGLIAATGTRLNTFEVREAVWRLIDKNQADYTPTVYLKAIS